MKLKPPYCGETAIGVSREQVTEIIVQRGALITAIDDVLAGHRFDGIIDLDFPVVDREA